MGPDGPREEIQRAIEASGCKVRADPVRGGFYSVDCPTYQARAEVVNLLAWRDGLYRGDVYELGRELVRYLPDKRPELLARRIHQAVRDRVHYVGEAGDVVQDPIDTWEWAMGDCDCHTRLVLALLRSLGVECALWPFTDEDERPGPGGRHVKHVCGVWECRPGAFVWMETTLPGAQFGEHPRAAAERLFAHRTDLRR
jgi:transglutaminase-like putative cysteine protease